VKSAFGDFEYSRTTLSSLPIGSKNMNMGIDSEETVLMIVSVVIAFDRVAVITRWTTSADKTDRLTPVRKLVVRLQWQ
jgi:hypothetical protein